MKRYLCFDPAINEAYTLYRLQLRYPQHFSLFKNTADAGLWESAPRLFHVNDNFYQMKQSDRLIQLNHCIVLESSEVETEILHFFHQRIYRQRDGKHFFYRLWDARVFERYISSSDDSKAFFDWFPHAFILNDDEKTMTRFEISNYHQPKTSVITIDEALPDEREPEANDDQEDLSEHINEIGNKKNSVNNEHDTKEQEPEKTINKVDEQAIKRRKFFID